MHGTEYLKINPVTCWTAQAASRLTKSFDPIEIQHMHWILFAQEIGLGRWIREQLVDISTVELYGNRKTAQIKCHFQIYDMIFQLSTEIS